MNQLIQALIKARNDRAYVTYKQAKDMVGEKHMCKAFGVFNHLASQHLALTGDRDLFRHLHNGKGPGAGFARWEQMAIRTGKTR